MTLLEALIIVSVYDHPHYKTDREKALLNAARKLLSEAAFAISRNVEL